MSQINKVNIPVQMGSRKFQIHYEYTFNDFSLNVEQLMRMVLKKLYPKNDQFDELVKTYRIFENAFGVERVVKRNENILNLFANQTELKSNVYFIVRKKSQKLKANRPKTMNAKKLFEKLHKERQNELKVVDDQEKINSINLPIHKFDRDTVKEAFMNKILENETILNQQIRRIDCLDQIMEQKRGIKSKYGSFFQTICSKLKHQNKTKRNNFNQSSVYLVDSAGESSSASSSRNSSSSKLDTLF